MNNDEKITVQGSAPKKKKTILGAVNKRKLKYGSLATAITIVVIAMVVLVNVIMTALFERFPISLDLTSGNVFSVSDETVEYIKSINVPVTITVMADEANFVTLDVNINQANELLKKYTQYNSNITLQYKDLLQNPDFASGYQETLQNYDVVIEAEHTDSETGETIKRVKVIPVSDLVRVSSDYADYYNQYVMYYGPEIALRMFSQYGYITSSQAEQEFTSAIMAVTDKNPVTVTVLTFPGADESDVSGLTNLLDKNGYIINSVNIQQEDIPEDTRMIIVPAPKVDYGPDEVAKIADWLNNDGNLNRDMLYVASVEQGETPNLDQLLEEFGLVIDRQVIVETNQKYYNIYPYNVFQNMVSENYTEDIRNKDLSILVPWARPVKVLYEASDRKETEVLLSSSTSAVLCPFNADSSWTPETAEEKGSFNSVALCTKLNFLENNVTVMNRVIACGSDQMLMSSLMTSTSLNNGDFMLSLINSITNKSEGITIVPKTVSSATFDISAAQINTLKWTFQLIVPLAVLIAGMVVWVRRRNR